MRKFSFLCVLMVVLGMLPVLSISGHSAVTALVQEAYAESENSGGSGTAQENAAKESSAPASETEAPAGSDKLVIATVAGKALSTLVAGMSSVLFYEIFGFPFLVLWLVIGGVFFTVRLGFVNIRMFKHAVTVVAGKYDNKSDPGEVTHLKALSAAVSGTVGLGNIAGVAVAVSMGGPGAVIWMVIAGMVGMSTKFAEVTMGHKYRKIDESGKVAGGAFYYLSEGLAKRNMPKFGKVLSIIFAFACIGGALGGGNMFQANQTVTILTNTFSSLHKLDWLIALVMAIGVGTVLIGGIKRIATVAEAIVPLMAVLYVSACLVVIFVNIHHVPQAFLEMVQGAFNFSAAGGGMVGAIIAGFRRAAFSNEAGLGSAPIAHAAAKTKEPVREGCVALLEPFIDTVVICFMSGIVMTVTEVYTDKTLEGGVLMTSAAFATVVDWFPDVLSVSIGLFAFSTMITWSYYGERAWNYIFGKKVPVSLYHGLFCTMTFFGGVVNFGIVLDFSDLLILSMAIPNLIGLYIMSGEVREELRQYVTKLKIGAFDANPMTQKEEMEQSQAKAM